MTLTTQFYTLIAMIGMGSCFGAALDTYQHFLKRAERKRWIVFFHDLFFWLIQALLIFYVLLNVNEGELRFYSLLALLCGFAGYQALLKNGYMRILGLLIRIVTEIIRLIRKIVDVILVKPVIIIVTSLIFLVKMIISFLLSFLKMGFRVILFTLKIFIYSPVRWALRLVFNMLPVSFGVKIKKAASFVEGIFTKITNSIKTFPAKWKRKDD